MTRRMKIIIVAIIVLGICDLLLVWLFAAKAHQHMEVGKAPPTAVTSGTPSEEAPPHPKSPVRMTDDEIVKAAKRHYKITEEEWNYLKQMNFLKDYPVASGAFEDKLPHYLSIIRSPRREMEGVFLVNDSVGANGGLFKTRSRSGEVFHFYWCASWGKPTLILKGSCLPTSLVSGDPVKVVFTRTAAIAGNTMIAIGVFPKRRHD